jgi:GNAT superfamily N-acetyltransferase
LEAYQKHGYSRHFLEFVEEYLRNMGFDVLFSSSQVDDPNLQAWYRHMGFEECGIINGINDGGIGEVFFRKYL